MTQAEENRVVAATLLEISKALLKVDANDRPIRFWDCNRKLAECLTERAKELVKETRQSLR